MRIINNDDKKKLLCLLLAELEARYYQEKEHNPGYAQQTMNLAGSWVNHLKMTSQTAAKLQKDAMKADNETQLQWLVRALPHFQWFDKTPTKLQPPIRHEHLINAIKSAFRTQQVDEATLGYHLLNGINTFPELWHQIFNTSTPSPNTTPTTPEQDATPLTP